MLELTLDTSVELAASGARHGAGLFETIRVMDGRPLRLEAHLARLSAGTAFLGLEMPPSVGEVQAFLNAHTQCADLASGVLRLLAVDGRLMITLAPWQNQRPERIVIGLSYEITRWSGSPLNRFKTLSYLENLLLAREASERGLFDVVALNESEWLTDGGRTNVFLVKGDYLLTPPASDGALPGIARAALLEAGLAREASLSCEDLAEAKAVCLSNALQGVVPVHGVEDRSVDADHPLIHAAVEFFVKA
jgi:branched-chain amino acid aminotransferase